MTGVQTCALPIFTHGSNGTFVFPLTGPLGTKTSPQSITTINDAGTTGSITVDAGSFTVGEIPQQGWTLTGSTCDAGTGGNLNADGIPQTWSFTVAPGGTVTCLFDNSGPMATRTQGFWAAHYELTDNHWPSGEKLCNTTLTAPGIVLGGFWANIGKTSTGDNRKNVDKARMTLVQQLEAAILNKATFGTSDNGAIAAGKAAFCGNNQNAMKTAQGALDTYNQSGDLYPSAAIDALNAQPKEAKALADIPFWDNLPLP